MLRDSAVVHISEKGVHECRFWYKQIRTWLLTNSKYRSKTILLKSTSKVYLSFVRNCNFAFTNFIISENFCYLAWKVKRILLRTVLSESTLFEDSLYTFDKVGNKNELGLCKKQPMKKTFVCNDGKTENKWKGGGGSR